MFCPECGTKLSDDARFCPECGSSVGIKKEVSVAPVQVQTAVNTPAQTVQAQSVPAQAVSQTLPAAQNTEQTKNIHETQQVKLSEVQDNYYEDTQPIDLRFETARVDIYADSQPETNAQPVPAQVVQPQRAKPPREPKVRVPGAIKNKIIFSALLALFYAGVFVISLFFLNQEEAITFKASADIAYTEKYSVEEFVDVLTKGNDYFNPTSLSTTLGIAINVFLYAAPVLAVVAFLSTVISKRTYSLHLMFVFISTLAAGVMAAFMPVALYFVPGFEDSLMLSRDVFVDQVQSIQYTTPIVCAGIMMACVIGAFVVTIIFNVRRKKYEV